METLSGLRADVAKALEVRLGVRVEANTLVLQTTREEFEGDYTLVVFPWIKQARTSPERLAEDLGTWLQENSAHVSHYNVVKGFLNLTLSNQLVWDSLRALSQPSWWLMPANGRRVMVEYSSPNTNKPLHLGHIRNNLLGWSIAKILEATGTEVIMANLVNDRGIHICKSMVAWLRYGNGDTPESVGQKGDHFVGAYYVRYDKAYQAEVKELIAKGVDPEAAQKQAPILLEAQDLLRKWEANDSATRALWERMNAWVYAGFDQTYEALGIHFDRVYYESQTYLLGKQIVKDGLAKGILEQHDDGSVWIDLRPDGLDEKLLLRSDGTSVYMTQDLGTAVERFKEYQLDDSVYVVGNEQEYHFQVLRKLLGRLGYEWSERIYHLSYGMITLPEGKMKSREGTVVDADDLIADLFTEAAKIGKEQGKAADLSEADANEIYRKVSLGALKYYMLKIDPAKGILFRPDESVDFNGNTGPFLQYTCARAYSILRKLASSVSVVEASELLSEGLEFRKVERSLIWLLHDYQRVILDAAQKLSPALVANYVYDLASRFNQFYHECPIAREENLYVQQMRLRLTQSTLAVLCDGLRLLGIEAPEQM